MCVKLFSKGRPLHSRACMRITGDTDNKGNSFAVSRAMSIKWPLTVLLVELSEELRHERVSLALDWVPRDENQEADDLSNMKVDGFSPERQIHVKGQGLVWRVLPELMAASQTLYEQMTAERNADKRRGPAAASVEGPRPDKRPKLGPR